MRHVVAQRVTGMTRVPAGRVFERRHRGVQPDLCRRHEGEHLKETPASPTEGEDDGSAEDRDEQQATSRGDMAAAADVSDTGSRSREPGQHKTSGHAHGLELSELHGISVGFLAATTALGAFIALEVGPPIP